MTYISELFSSSTADDEKNYFTGQPAPAAQPSVAIPNGTYRVIDGRLYQIVKGVPTTMQVGGDAE